MYPYHIKIYLKQEFIRNIFFGVYRIDHNLHTTCRKMAKMTDFPKFASFILGSIFYLLKSGYLTFYYFKAFVNYFNIPFESGICQVAHLYQIRTPFFAKNSSFEKQAIYARNKQNNAL